MSASSENLNLKEVGVRALINTRLSMEAFSQLSGILAGVPFVKVVVDKNNQSIHFLNNAIYSFHADYIAEVLLGISRDLVEKKIDYYNKTFYVDPDRRFYLGVLALHQRNDKKFFSLETVEVDTMNLEMMKFFCGFVCEWIDPSLPLLFKPANHLQEATLSHVDAAEFPRIYSHELFESKDFVILNRGATRGRIRAFATEREYQEQKHTLEWFDILAMDRVPDDIPRVSGIINAQHTTPLSHTNVLAHGWQIPNATQIGALKLIADSHLDHQWVEYSVNPDVSEIGLRRIERPGEVDRPPIWKTTKVRIEEPEIQNIPILHLSQLRMSDRSRYGTKAANLGEIHHILKNGSGKICGFYRVKRPPRENLLPHLAHAIGVPESADIEEEAANYLRGLVHLPRGIAIPFALQQQFLESSPKIQQAIGKLKMALELNARQVDSLCVSLQKMIVSTKIPARIFDMIDTQIAKHLGGVENFVVRSSSNAEDLQSFSAAGIYESVNRVTTSEKIFQSIKQVWASVLSPRSVRLRQDAGISLDDVYMGVIIQEETPAKMGGVLITTNPTNREDFRNVYFNISLKSTVQVVQGTELPYQCLYNTVEGGGRTLSLGGTHQDLDEHHKELLQKLAYGGRLLQSHFSPDYTFNSPVDIEWLINDEGIYVLQLRPYSG